MAEYRLHGFAESGNSYKPAMMLAACGADWEPVFVAPPQLGDPAWRAKHNETGEVPVLEHNGVMHQQSAVILDYLAETLGKYGWANADERRAVQRWLYYDNHKFTPSIGTARFRRLILNIDDAITQDAQNRFVGGLQLMDKHFADNDWVVLGRTTIADISMAGYMFFDGEIHVDWADYPNMRRWLDRVAALPGWKPPYEMLPAVRDVAPAH